MSERTDWDGFAKQILRDVFGNDYRSAEGAIVDYGPNAARGVIDGTISGQIAVEVESRNNKQIRGALMDLICHAFERKLLIVIPANVPNPSQTMAMCRAILGRFVSADRYRVVVMQPSGRIEEFIEAIRRAATELGWRPAA